MLKINLLFFLVQLISSTPINKLNCTKAGIESIKYRGSGCKQDSVSYSFSEDRTSFTVIYDNFIATSGPSIPISESIKECRLTIKINSPKDLEYSFEGVDYRGYTQLDQNVNLTQSSFINFSGFNHTKEIKTLGPFDGDYLFHDEIEQDVWSGCRSQTLLKLNHRIVVERRGDVQGFVTSDSSDGTVLHRYGMKWRECKKFS